MVLKCEFKLKLEVKLLEKYEFVVKSTSSTSAFDFEVKFEVAMRAVEVGGDLIVIFSGFLLKIVNLLVGMMSVEVCVNYCEFGFMKVEWRYYSLYVETEEAASE